MSQSPRPSRNQRFRSAATQAMAYPFSLRTAIMELFDIGPFVAFSVLAFAAALVVAAAVYFVRSAPPSTVTISAGPEGSQFYKNSVKYAKILERNGVSTRILTSKGSLENLARLNDSGSGVDVGVVQAGPVAPSAAAGPVGPSGAVPSATPNTDSLISLGSISYQPLMIFYRGAQIQLLSELKGKRVAIGPVGSGTRNVALAILSVNGIKEGGETTLLDQDAATAAQGLKDKQLDAAFVMSESASMEVMKVLIRDPAVRLYSFKQAPAYSRKFDYLNVLELPEGVIDPGLNIPSKDVALVAPMVELVAVKHLHPALIDLLVEAATEVHSRPGFYQKRGEFPMAVEHNIHLSEDASVYYKSGKGFLYRALPFWLASLLSRLVLVLVPLLVILVPTLKSVPAFFRWISQLRIRKRYRELRLLEQRFALETDPQRLEVLRQELGRIEQGVNKMKVRASFAEQFYALRGHIDYVRRGVG